MARAGGGRKRGHECGAWLSITYKQVRNLRPCLALDRRIRPMRCRDAPNPSQVFEKSLPCPLRSDAAKVRSG